MMSQEEIEFWLIQSKEYIKEAQEDDTYRELELEIEILEAILNG